MIYIKMEGEVRCKGKNCATVVLHIPHSYIKREKKLSSEDSQRYHDLHKTEVEVFCEGKNCATGVGNLFHTFHIHISTGISLKSDAGR
jgi:hypothetical protein